MSLYDYLGRAAGSILGKQVADEAVKQGEEIGTKYVSNRFYQGDVMTYSKSFLDSYFKKNDSELIKRNLNYEPFQFDDEYQLYERKGRDEYGLDWSKYNDQLDMDQQDPEFW